MWKNDFRAICFCCYNRSVNFFFWACAVQTFRKGGGGGLKLGLNVFHHNNNNNFNLINIYSAKSITIEYKKITDLFTV